MANALFDFQLKGADELLAALRQLDDKGSNKVMSRALKAGAGIVLNQARQDAPKRTGAMAAALKIKTANKKRKHRLAATVTLGGSMFKGKFYAPFTNYGRHVGYRSLASIVAKKDQTAKFIEGTRWMNKSFEKSAPAALEAIGQTARQELNSVKGGK
ncbi:MAG: HK97 gp10 family phage protein [Phycisphaerales bacterium]|nr:HK97 gp10 family phage protein [Phycisphaerales bacterium]